MIGEEQEYAGIQREREVVWEAATTINRDVGHRASDVRSTRLGGPTQPLEPGDIGRTQLSRSAELCSYRIGVRRSIEQYLPPNGETDVRTGTEQP